MHAAEDVLPQFGQVAAIVDDDGPHFTPQRMGRHDAEIAADVGDDGTDGPATHLGGDFAAQCRPIMLLEGWRSWYGMQPYPPLHTRVWGWVMIAAIPILFSVFRMRKSTLPVIAASAFSIALPWCSRVLVEHYGVSSWSRTEPSFAAHALVAGFCVFLIWWGVRESSRGLVNLGILGFGATVAWFYFSDLFDKMDRSLALIGLGVLFLAGGWALEKTRRGLLAHMAQAQTPLLEGAR